MTGEDEPRQSFGGLVDGAVDGHLAAYLEQHPDQHVPLTLGPGGPGGPAVGDAELHVTPRGVEVTGRIVDADIAARISGPPLSFSIGDTREHNDAAQRVDEPALTRDDVLERVKAWARQVTVPLAPWQVALASRAIDVEAAVARAQAVGEPVGGREMERPSDLVQYEGGRPPAHMYGLPIVESRLVPEGQRYFVGRDALEPLGHVEGFAPVVDAAAVAREAWLWGRSIRMTATVMHGRTVQVQLAPGGARRLAKLLGVFVPWTPAQQRAAWTEYRRKTRRRNRRRAR